MPNPQIWLFGTPPTTTDDPHAFTKVRDSAMRHQARYCWIEWAAELGDDYDDPATWAKANPSFGVRISAEACADDRGAMDDDQFALERLGMWAAGVSNRVIPEQSWKDAGVETSTAVDRLALGVEVGRDMAWASVSLAGQRSDGDWHIELDERRDGSAWVVPYVTGLLSANPTIRAVVADAGSPSNALLPEFKAAHIEVTAPTVKDLGSACSRLLEGVVTGSVRHIKQPQMSTAASVATKRKLGDTGMWVWHRANATTDITPIQAATLALWGSQSDDVKRPTRRSSQAFAF